MSDAGKCPFDGAEISAGRWICMDCERQLKSNLEYLRDHIDDLIEVANKQARPGPLDLAKGAHSSPSSPPLPVRADAWEQCQAIRTWAHQVVAGHSVRVSLSVMALHTGDLTRNRTIPILAAQAKEHQRNMQGILDWEDEKRRGGKCMECGTVLWVLDESRYAICEHCGALNDLAETRAIQRDEIVNSYKQGTSREVASTLTQCGWPITARSIRRYAAKGLVNPGQGTDGKSLYNVGEIIHLIENNIPA